MIEYPNPETLRAQAARLESESPAISDSSEYPRVAKMAVAGQVEALRNFAETLESVGRVAPKRPGMTGEERRQRRADILRLRAARLQLKASEAHRRSHDIGSRIPFGQPILVGHHSERGHRRAIDRMHKATGDAIAAGQYADTLESRADSVERSHAIAQSDSDAAEQYQAKLDKLTRQREHMKTVNATWRRYAAGKEPAEAIEKLGYNPEELAAKIKAGYSWEKQPFVGWQISNLGAVIRDTEKKLARARTVATMSEVVIESADGIRVEDSPQDNRVRLFFPGKPAAEVRAQLKRHGYRWAPSLGCWQAFRNWSSMEHAKTYVPKPPAESEAGQ